MAAIMRSAIGKTARRALSMEGTLSVRPLHAIRSTNRTRTVDASHGKHFPKPLEVDPLVKKIEGVATKQVLVEYIERQQRKGMKRPPGSKYDGLKVLTIDIYEFGSEGI